MPPSVQRVVEVVKNAEQYKEKVIASLPISDAQKAQLTETLNSVQEKVVNRIVHSPVVTVVDSAESVEDDAPIQLTLGPHDTTKPHVTVIHTTVVTDTAVTDAPVTKEVSSADSQ
jgi:hypothetical protein